MGITKFSIPLKITENRTENKSDEIRNKYALWTVFEPVTTYTDAYTDASNSAVYKFLIFILFVWLFVYIVIFIARLS